MACILKSMCQFFMSTLRVASPAAAGAIAQQGATTGLCMRVWQGGQVWIHMKEQIVSLDYPAASDA